VASCAAAVSNAAQLPSHGVGCLEHSQISSDDVFEHRGLSAGLRSYDGDLGQIYGILDLRHTESVGGLRHARGGLWRGVRRVTYSYCGEDILELVYEGDQGRVVDVDAVGGAVSIPHVVPRGCQE
jgi:hypothetical protein